MYTRLDEPVLRGAGAMTIPVTAAIVLLVMGQPAASGLRSLWDTGGFSDLDTTFLEAASSGQSSTYLNRTSGQWFDYDAGSRTLSANLTPPPGVPLFVLGADVTFAEAGDAFYHNKTSVTCDATFCVDGIVRIVGNYEARLVLQWWGHDSLGRNKTVTPDPFPIDTSTGRPIVAGGETAVFQNTIAAHCFIEAWVDTRVAGGSGPWERITDKEGHKCVKS